MEAALIIVFVAFVLWLGAKILDKAGLHKAWIFRLLMPIVNIIMVWVFAFSHRPNFNTSDSFY